MAIAGKEDFMVYQIKYSFSSDRDWGILFSTARTAANEAFKFLHQKFPTSDELYVYEKSIIDVGEFTMYGPPNDGDSPSKDTAFISERRVHVIP